ncbi:hypothetical protein E5329_03515 [Petralouisia muris]|uniref:Uncharacterized protein n=1 Tax=Petralouisia muris TaxID=3032872 RepID=A0AC61S0B0_9FIRM|nr:hypothetical protein E5329_03515 [Petralouisia muris]
MTSLEGKFDSLEDRITSLEGKFNSLEDRITSLETQVIDLQAQIKDIHLILENEIRINIQRVAEGHLDLSRNLHNAMEPSSEVEMLAIKVRKLESDVNMLKQRLA